MDGCLSIEARKMFAAAICLLVFVLSAGALSVRMELQPEVVRLGEAAQLVVSVEDADRAPAPELPPIPGVRISGPSTEQSVSMSLVNGRMQRQRRINFRYSLMPLQPGEHLVGPIVYTHDNRTVRVPPKTLRVVSSGRDSGYGDGESRSMQDMVFVRLHAAKTGVYVQEPFTLTIAVYSRDVNLGRDVSLLNMPETGIRIQPFQELRMTREVVREEVYDVRRYQTRVRPLTSGTLVFEPVLRLQALVPAQRRGRGGLFDDPFFQGLMSGMEAHPLDVRAQALEISVWPLPEEGRPESFTGGVGEFKFNARVQDAEVQPGDPVTVAMLIEGRGNMDVVSTPAVQESDRFRVYPPRVTHSDVDESGYAGRKEFEQVIIPRTSEARDLPALEFSFFNPETGKYQTIVTETLRLTLREGDPVAPRIVRAAAASADARTRIVGEDIHYLKPVPEKWMRSDAPNWCDTGIFKAAQATPLLALVTALLLARRRRVLEADAALARRRRAPRNARAGLKRARSALSSNSDEIFYNGLWEAMTAYFGDRLNLSSGAVTRDEVVPAMRRQGLDEVNAGVLENVFDACEQHRFGRVAMAPDTKHTLLAQFRNLLKTCERLPS